MNRNLLFVAIALLTWGFGEGLFFNFQPIYLKSLGSSEQQIGFILGEGAAETERMLNSVIKSYRQKKDLKEL